MPATDYQGSSAPFSSLGRSILGIKRDQVHAMEGSRSEQELEGFLKLVADQFQNLSSENSGEILSLSWVRRLLDAFLCCQEHFHVILLNSKTLLSKPPLDRLVSEFFDRSIKALDICNSIRDGVQEIRQWQKHLEIVLSAFDSGHRSLNEGQFRRAMKALCDLSVSMWDEREAGAGVLARRNRSFGRAKEGRPPTHFRSLSWSVSRSWSAAKQLQGIGSNLNPPKSNEISSTGGLAVAIFAMNSILLFVMWALVAAIPCQDRGLQTHFAIPRQFGWGQSIVALHERVLEESKKRERRNTCGLLKEVGKIEKCTRKMTEVVDSVCLPLNKEKEMEIRQGVEEVAEVLEALKEGLSPLEHQVREVFHRIVRSRTDCLDCLGHPEY